VVKLALERYHPDSPTPFLCEEPEGFVKKEMKTSKRGMTSESPLCIKMENAALPHACSSQGESSVTHAMIYGRICRLLKISVFAEYHNSKKGYNV